MVLCNECVINALYVAAVELAEVACVSLHFAKVRVMSSQKSFDQFTEKQTVRNTRHKKHQYTGLAWRGNLASAHREANRGEQREYAFSGPGAWKLHGNGVFFVNTIREFA